MHSVFKWRGAVRGLEAEMIEQFLADDRLRQVDRVAVAAEPKVAWEAVRSLDLNRVWWMRALFALRTLPERLPFLRRRQVFPRPHRLGVEEITRPGSGFLLLSERPGAELVVGAVGEFWRLRIRWAEVTPWTFAAFREPGFGKLAWSLRVDPRGGGGSWISLELRVAATSESAWARFQRYWRWVGPFSRLIRLAGLHLLARELGRASAVQFQPLPGDELLPMATFERTHRQIIEAPPERVWPWLVRGSDQSGDADQDQTLHEGDLVSASAEPEALLAVLDVKPKRRLVLGSPELLSPELLPPELKLPGTGGQQSELTTWAFVLERIGSAATELILRTRVALKPGQRLGLRGMVDAVAHGLMERAQLRGLKQRIERAPALVGTQRPALA